MTYQMILILDHLGEYHLIYPEYEGMKMVRLASGC